MHPIEAYMCFLINAVEHDGVIKWEYFRVTGSLCREFTGQRWILFTKASDVELWCFLPSVPEQPFEQTIETPAIWDAIALMTNPVKISWWLQTQWKRKKASRFSLICFTQTYAIRFGVSHPAPGEMWRCEIKHFIWTVSVLFNESYWIWWRHQMETFSCYWLLVRGIHRSTVNSLHKGQWRGALTFSFICAWTNVWVNNRNAGDLRCHRTHDVTVMK